MRLEAPELGTDAVEPVTSQVVSVIIRDMSNRIRVGLAVVACLIGLTGCVRFDGDLQVHSDETVSGTLQVGVYKQSVQSAGWSESSARRQIESEIKFVSSDQAECKTYENDTFMGSTCTLNKVPFAELGSSAGEGFYFRKDGNEFVVTVRARALTAYPRRGQEADFELKITMPGKIINYDPGATVIGRTATYDSSDDINDVSLRSEDGAGFPLWAIVLIALLLLAALAALMFLLRRKRYPPGQPNEDLYPPGQSPVGQSPTGQWGPQYGAQPGQQSMHHGQPMPHDRNMSGQHQDPAQQAEGNRGQWGPSGQDAGQRHDQHPAPPPQQPPHRPQGDV